MTTCFGDSPHEFRVPGRSSARFVFHPGRYIRAPAPPRPSVDSRELLQGERELIIRHGNQEYRLRHTQNDKLILTK